MTAGWRLTRHTETAHELHARELPERVTRELWVCEATSPALVLGSAQRDDTVDRGACERSGIDVVRRRSGGGAVLVAPGALLWVDVLVPVDDVLWRADVGDAFLWLGEAWARALDELGVRLEVHRGSLVRTQWSDLVCFAGLGRGELVDGAGRKVLGVSQRRTRAGARFQCALLLDPWDPRSLLDLLALTPAERSAAAADLRSAAVGLSDLVGPVDATTALDALISHLP